MKKILALAGFVVACAACCAMPAWLAAATWAGGAAVSGLAFGFGWELAVVVVAGGLGVAAVLARRRRRATVCDVTMPASGECSCDGMCARAPER